MKRVLYFRPISLGRLFLPVVPILMFTLLVAAEEPAEQPPASPKSHWAFLPVKRVSAPSVRDTGWPRNDVDRFILADLESKNLAPAKPADRRTLIRRAYFDLLGLPPTPEEVAAFVADASPDAWDVVVDRLLANPHYGERWGRCWLDLARYADTNGSDENYAYPNAWRYRDYIVRAFNDEKPYDLLIAEQLAGDVLAPEPNESEQQAQDRLIATGFLMLGPKMLAEQDKQKLVMDVVDEQIDVVGQTFLGLTLGCARCHDHKFDPIPTVDYYALAGVFKSTRTMADLGHVSNWHERELPSAAHRAAVADHAAKVAAAKADVDAFKKEIAATPVTDAPKRNAEEDAAKLKGLEGKVAELEKAASQPPRAMAVAGDEPQDVPVHLRGSHLTLAPVATPRGFIHIFDSCLIAPSIAPTHSGRLELVKWLTDPANPLTSRVMVNRIWQGHFGVGIVSTSSNFGLRGAAPTHPELLDWLANEFVKSGWSIKQMHRLMMRSAAYQMSSVADAHAIEVDPENHLLARQNRRRLEVEPIRDSLFAVTGDLDLTIGGALPMAEQDRYTAIKEDDVVFQSNRRAIYLPVVRSRMYEMFGIFDYVDAGVHTPRRAVTTVPQQALFMLNSDLAGRQAAALGRKLISVDGIDDATRVSRAYEILYARPATKAEVERSLAHLASASTLLETGADLNARRLAAWTSLCRVLLAANEFVYVN